MSDKELCLEEVFIDADLGVWGDIDGDNSIEKVYASVFKINVFRENKFLKSLEISARKEIREINKGNEFRTETEIGNILTKLALCDLDRDGRKEIIAGRADGILAALDHKGRTLWSTDLIEYVVSLDVDDVNGDGKLEIVAITSGGTVILLNHKGKKIWHIEYPKAYSPNDVKLIKHGNDVFILLGMKDGRVIMLDKKGREKETFYPLRESIKIIKVMDVTGDGQDNIILGGDVGGLAIMNLRGDILRLHRFNSEIVGVSTRDVNDDGKIEVIAGDWEGTVKILNIDEIIYSREQSVEIQDDVDGDGELEKVVRYWKRITLFKHDKKLWEEEFSRWVSAIDVFDINNDGKKEIIVGGLDKTLRVYTHNGKPIGGTHLLRAPLGVLVNDVDGDNVNEIVSVGEKEVRIFKVKKS